MKKIFLAITTAVCLLGTSSCSDMLDVESNSQTLPSLDEKTDSVTFALGIAQAMQELADQYYFQNELRGELVTTTSDASTDLQNLASFSAGTENKYDSVYRYYKVINNCNYYLANRDTTLSTSNVNVVMNEYLAIAAYRGWTYLQLTHQYGDVPYVTEPMLTISQINEVTEKTAYETILRSEAEYLQSLKNSATDEQLAGPVYSDSYLSIGTPNWTTTTRNIHLHDIFVPLNLVLGDIYLELGEYRQAALCYFDYLLYDGNHSSNSNIATAYYALREPWDRDEVASFSMPSNYDYSSTQNEVGSNNTQWYNVFLPEEDAARYEGISIIPMACNYTLGTTTEVPDAYGYDYYASSRASYDNSMTTIISTPEKTTQSIIPSDTYLNLAKNADYYYRVSSTGSTKRFGTTAAGDARCNQIVRGGTQCPDNYYVQKPATATFILYRNSTVYMHLAEAFNRMGYPELAFAILKNGLQSSISTFLPSNYVEGGEIAEENYYLTQEAYDLLVNDIPFFSDANIATFTNASNSGSASSSNIFVGIHQHGGGAVADIRSPYVYKTIVEAKIDSIRNTFNVNVGATEYTQDEYINAMEDLLVDEYAQEFAFEGTRFGDLIRIARHKNMSSPYSSNFGDTWLSNKLATKAAGITTQNCYLPFN